MATRTPANITEKSIESLRSIQGNLDKGARDAASQGDKYMASVYIELLAIVSAKVLKLQARMTRERLAAHRKAHKGIIAPVYADDIEQA